MKNLLQIMILASVCMVISQAMEIVSGPTTSGTAINMAAFALFGIGIWGLHQQQTQSRKSTMSLLGTALLSLGALAFVVLSVQIMQALQAGQPLDFVTLPVYMVAGACVGLGTILFGLSIIRINHFPWWTGILLMILPLVSIGTEVLLRTSEVRYYVNFLLAGAFIYMCIISIRKLQPTL